MKQILCILLVFVTVFSFVGCQKNDSDGDTVSFYYRKRDVSYGTADGIIAKEISEYAGASADPIAMLKLYLFGPRSDDLLCPFPEGTELLTLSFSDTTANVLLSEHIGQLTGIDLTIACACIALTVMDLTGKESVTIQANHTMLDGANQITLNRDSLLLLDDLIPAE